MKFDYCIGNPPYQDPTPGSTKQLWFDFLKTTKDIASSKMFIHPGRWVIPTAAYKKYRDAIINDLSCKSFNYFPKSGDAFSNVSIDGGITITFFNNSDKQLDYFINGEYKGPYTIDKKVFSNKIEEEVYDKVFANIDVDRNMLRYASHDFCDLGHHSYEHIKDQNLDFILDSNNNLKEPIAIYLSKTTGKGSAKYRWYWIEKENLVNVPSYIYTSRKIMIDGRGHSLAHGVGNVINNLPVICNKNAIGYGVYFIVPVNDTDRELELIRSLFMTKTARYLMCITQKSLYVRGFENIPDYIELAKLLPEDQPFTDQWFYKTFNFSQELINDIETRVSPKIDRGN